jgi:hypothetical protein
VAGVLYAAGAAHLAGYLTWRGDIARRVASAERPEARAADSVAAEVRRSLEETLGEARLVSARPVPFGGRRAGFGAWSSSESPSKVFGAVVRRWAAAAQASDAAAGGEIGERVVAGTLQGAPWLAHVRPDRVAVARGRLALTRATLLVAYPRSLGRWEYVAWSLGAGTDLSALEAELHPPESALRALSKALEPVLEARLGIDASADGSKRLLLCRARGEPGDALDRAVAALGEAGWRTDGPDLGAEGRGVRSLARGPDRLRLHRVGPDDDPAWVTIWTETS